MRKFSTGVIASAILFAGFAQPAVASDPEAVALGRCELPSAAPVFDRRSGYLPGSWSIENSGGNGSKLPSVMVDGWKPEPMAANALLSKLMSEAGLEYSGPAGLPVVAWDGHTASLEQTVSEIVRKAAGDWTFDGKTLHVFSSALPSTANASFTLPVDRDQKLATIDILRAFDISVSVSGNEVAISGPRKELEEARKALGVARDLRVYDVIFMRGRPVRGRYDWAQLGAIRETPVGAGGQFVFSDENLDDLVTRMGGAGDLVQDSVQSVAAPEGWSLSVPAQQCGTGMSEVMVGLEEEASGMTLSVHGQAGQADFEAFALGTTALSVSGEPSEGWISMVAVRPRVVNFVGI